MRRMASFFVENVGVLAAGIADGDHVAVAKIDCGPAMTLTRRLLADGRRNLRLLTLPTSGLQADLMIGAGSISEIETSGISLGEYGQAPAFGRAVKEGAITVKDFTCPAVYTALQAAEKGVPFMPLRGLIGSDILAWREDVKVIDNPYADGGDPIALIPAAQPDVTMFHAPKADRFGNVWVGRAKPLMLLSHAARKALVTVEEVVDDNLLNDPVYGPATIPSLYISAIAVAPQGAWPYRMEGYYEADGEHLALYAGMARSEEGFQRYFEGHVLMRERSPLKEAVS